MVSDARRRLVDAGAAVAAADGVVVVGRPPSSPATGTGVTGESPPSAGAELTRSAAAASTPDGSRCANAQCASTRSPISSGTGTWAGREIKGSRVKERPAPWQPRSRRALSQTGYLRVVDEGGGQLRQRPVRAGGARLRGALLLWSGR